MTINPIDYRQQLKQLFGFDDFRQGQEQVVRHLLEGHSSLAIFPTGSGKSLCYQFVATQLPYLTLVVSPLLALMKDQLAFLHSKGIAAASIDSSLTEQERQQVVKQIKQGQCKILMVSVERFKNERFRQFIQSIPISLLVVDEAHCISEWGHNFRPDYLKLPSYQQSLNIPQTLLLTATATAKVKQDMAKRFAIAQSHIVQTGFYRNNLNLDVLPVTESQKHQQVLRFLQEQSGAGIIYVTLQQSAEQLAEFLKQQGINARAYHAGLGSDVRAATQLAFMQNSLEVVVATIAFGMGIDKSDIRFVLHFDLPKSIENYSQEIGRAGRDGQWANCRVLANLDGLMTVENFVYADTPDLVGIEAVINDIKSYQNNLNPSLASQRFQWETQLNTLSVVSNIRQLPLKTLLVQLELMKVLEPSYSYFAEFKYRFVTPEAEILNLFNQQRRDFLKAVFTHSDMKKVWAKVNFDKISSVYPSERSRVISALEYLHEHNHIQLESRLLTDVWQVNGENLNRIDLAKHLSEYFAQNEQKEILRIQHLIEFFESPRCLNANLAEHFDDPQALGSCGHCSVCAGKVAKLHYSAAVTLPAPDKIQIWVNNFRNHLAGKYTGEFTLGMYCRFLTGMAMPALSRLKLRQVDGYAECAMNRYADVQQAVKNIL